MSGDLQRQSAHLPFEQGDGSSGRVSFAVLHVINFVDSLLPKALQDFSAETQHQAVLVVYAVALSKFAIFLTLGLLFGLGYTGTATRLAWILPLQIPPLLVLFVGDKPRLAAHALMILLLVEIAIDFGPDDGFRAVATVALPVAASALLGMAGGILWTVVAVLWAGYLGPFVCRVQDYSASISLSMAIVTLAVGVAAALNEFTRAWTLLMATRALRQLQATISTSAS